MRRFTLALVTIWVLGPTHDRAVAQPEKPPAGRFPIASSDDAWSKLPPPENPPFPAWAKVLVSPLPKTTARMLELDYLHRAENPLGTVLAAKIRYAVAETLGSKCGTATAAADLLRVGLSASDVAALAKPAGLPPAEAFALAFARKLTKEGHAISDDEFAELLRLYGPEKVTALVHTVAYANFHNRVMLGFGVTHPPDPPLGVKFDAEKLAKVAAPARPPWDDLRAATGAGPAARVEWSQFGFDDLALSLDKQKARKLRLPLPDLGRFKDLPPREKAQAERVVWTTISTGYQPGMTRAWFACLNEFYAESKVDRVFTNSMFWVVTRTNDCFY